MLFFCKLDKNVAETLLHYMTRGRIGRMNPDLSDSAPKVADLADFWPYFGADKTGGFPLKIRPKIPKKPQSPKKAPKSPKNRGPRHPDLADFRRRRISAPKSG